MAMPLDASKENQIKLVVSEILRYTQTDRQILLLYYKDLPGYEIIGTQNIA